MPFWEGGTSSDVPKLRDRSIAHLFAKTEKIHLTTMNTILIIEDQAVLRGVLAKKLERSGYTVLQASDGPDGAKTALDHTPDLILLDVLLPRQDGFWVLETLKKDESLTHIPVIIISNSGQPVEVERALALGANDYLVKANFTPEEVLEKVERILGPRPMVTPFAATRDVATKSLSSPVLPRQPNTLAILVVEDDRLLRNLIVKMLTHEGLVTDAAVDGREALEKVAKSSYRLILLDLILPDLDGFEVLQRLKANPASSKIPVVICSNLGQEDEIARGKELGAVDYLIKANFTPDEIVSKIREIL